MTRLSKRQFLKTSGAAVAVAPIMLTLSTPLRAATQHTVTIKGFKFDPTEIEVSAGDTILFENKDGAPHTATAKDQSWSTKTLSSNSSEEITFETVGEHDYFCKFHPNMKATVTVT